MTEAEQIFQAYPRRVAKIAALKAIKAALKRESFASLLAATEAYAKSAKGNAGQYTPHPATWFNAGSYLDDRKEWQHGSGKDTQRATAVITASHKEQVQRIMSERAARQSGGA